MLALQTLLERFLSPEIVWVLIPMMALSIPIIAIVTEPIKARLKQAERREARQMYERLAREKLDILKTAITMGYKHDDLADLDARLERLVGADKLQKLLGSDPKTPSTLELESADLGAQIDGLSQASTARERR
jgi:hypothetical protein